MKRLVLILAAVAVGCAAAAVVATTAKAHRKSQLKIISYNIRLNFSGDTDERSWDFRREASITMVCREQPDVIGMQEVRSEQAEYMAENLAEGYAHVDFGRDTGDENEPTGGEKMMIMYRTDRFALLESGHFWLSETPDRLSRGWDAVCRRIAVWVKLRERSTGKEFYCFDTHFDHIGKSARLHEAQMITAHIDSITGNPHATVFLIGDLNEEREGSPMVEHLDSWGKCARQTAAVTDHKNTYNGFGSDTEELIDYIYYRNATATRYATLDDDYGKPYISDHYPIAAWLEF